MSTFQKWAVFLLVFFLAPVLTGLLYLLVRHTLPREIPSPTDWWGFFDGDFDSIRPAAVVGMVIVSTVFLLSALAARLVRGPSDSDGYWIPAAVLGSSQMTWLWCLGVAISVGAPSAQAVHPQFWQYEVVLAVSLAQAALVHRLIPRVPREVATAPESSLVLGSGERVYWLGRSANRVRLWLAGVAFGASIVAALWSVPISLALLILVALSLQRATVMVRINNEAVRVSSSPWTWPQVRIPVGELASARVVQRKRTPLHTATYSDGARYREVTALVHGNGQVIVLEGPEMSPLAVSLPDAAEAADLVNALVARQRAANGMGVIA